ncbi:anti-sigma regulatory factor (Ser/Thr protein kinase) [Kitasatospora sp. MAP12-15]|uniref:ATP-binding protein n=1 Tax=unclassified Kitasatospora TaxID=2633591 RepID=UPI0024748278|nr:ATP-binding protein [Kitasatospora sp. MAP12-44]MDH6109189.1 anti-sigma regulatory factor (Ser/Thr protein kinase) [Kitasatospora sp. MAP12-44]
MPSSRTTHGLGVVPDLVPIDLPDSTDNVLRCELPVTTKAARTARAQLRHYFATHLTSTGQDNAELILTELVVNAVTASVGAGAIRLVAQLVAGELLIEVFDESPGMPRHRQVDDLAEDGRGLLLVEQLSAAWGWHPAPGGKVVWAVPKTDAA